MQENFCGQKVLRILRISKNSPMFLTPKFLTPIFFVLMSKHVNAESAVGFLHQVSCYVDSKLF